MSPETHSQLNHDFGDPATLGDFFKQFENVAKCLCGLATIDDGRQCTSNILAINGDEGEVVPIPLQPSFASTLPAQFHLM